jgi:hypothetical protein
MYFNNFPAIAYEFNIGDKTTVIAVTDITENVRFRKEILANINLYDEYDIVDGETPEIISEKFYGSPYYHWIVMLVNERYDYINDFPLSQTSLEKYIIDKYGSGNSNSTHHYENVAGFIVDSDHPQAESISNTQYEERINEGKRRIKIISSAVLQRILNQFKDIV